MDPLLVGYEGGDPQTLVRVHRRDGSLLRRLKFPRAGAGGSISDTALRVSHDGRWVAAPHLKDETLLGRVVIQAIESGDPIVLPNPQVDGWTDSVDSVAWVGSNLLVAYSKHGAILWSQAGERVSKLKRMRSVQAVPGRVLAFQEKPAAVTVYDETLAKGHTLALKGPLADVWISEISRGGHYAVLQGDEGTSLWNLDTNEVWPVPGLKGVRPTSMIVTFGGSEHDLFVTAETPNLGVRVYDARSKSAICELPSTEPPSRILVAPDATFWVTSESALEHYDRTGKKLASLRAPSTVEALEIVSAFFTTKGHIVTAAREEDVVQTWTQDGQAGAPLRWLGRKHVKLVPSADRTIAIGVSAYEVEIVPL